jgi:quinol monooxygenase YgiN
VFICSLGCRIRPDKEIEFLGSIDHLIKRTRWLKGCFGCRVVAELGDRHTMTFVTEWADRASLDRYLESDECSILLGMAILMEDEPRVMVDEVVTRTRVTMHQRA